MPISKIRVKFRIYMSLNSYGGSPINITFLSFAYFCLLWLTFITCCVTNCHTIKLWYDVSGEGLRKTRKSQPEIKVVLPLFHSPPPCPPCPLMEAIQRKKDNLMVWGWRSEVSQHTLLGRDGQWGKFIPLDRYYFDGFPVTRPPFDALWSKHTT